MRMRTQRTPNAATPEVSFCCPRIGRYHERWLLIHKDPWSTAQRKRVRPDHRWTKLILSYERTEEEMMESREFFVENRKTTGSCAIARKPKK